MFKIFFGHFWDRQGVFWVFRGPYRGKLIVDHFFELEFFCSPSGNLPIGSLRGPKVFKKNFLKKIFCQGEIPNFGYFWGKKRFLDPF